jgi:hypothetical protein
MLLKSVLESAPARLRCGMSLRKHVCPATLMATIRLPEHLFPFHATPFPIRNAYLPCLLRHSDLLCGQIRVDIREAEVSSP